MLTVCVTMPFSEAQLDRIRRVSPSLAVTREDPLYALDNVIVSPHVSGFVPSYDDWCSDLFAENLRRYLAGAARLNQVDRARGY